MERREREIEAAATLHACGEALAAGGRSLIKAVTGADDTVEWRHYPDGEAYDPLSHAQYFYHRHPAPPATRDALPPEHGHFHLFLRGEGMPAGSTPLLLPEIAVANAPLPRQSVPLKRGGRDEVCHLIAIAVDHGGQPIRLFTTNRWVTGETWYRADDVIRMLDCFCLRTDHPSALVNRWLGAIVRLFEAEIAGLLHRRDKAMQDWRWRWRTNAFEDPRLEIVSSTEIDLEARLGAVARGVAPAAAARRRNLPPMAEGWGG